MLYALGFIGLFTIGGLTGLFLATLGLDVHVHDTYFVVAHFHYIMVGGTIMGYLGGLHFWWPKMTGPDVPGVLGASSSALHRLHRLQPDVLPAVRARLPRHAAALPRLPGGVPGAERDVDRRARRSSASATCCPLVYLAWSLRYGKPRRPNPWGATGLEWQTPSPPPTDNFDETPVVTEEAVRLRDARRRRSTRCLSSRPRRGATPHAERSPHHFDDLEQQQRGRRRSGMWVFLAHRGHVLRRPVHRPTPSTARSTRRRSPRRATTSNVQARRVQHRRADRQQPDHGAGRPRGRSSASGRRIVGFLLADDRARRASFLGVKAVEYARQVRRTHLVPGAALRASTARRPDADAGTRSSSSRSTSR